MVSFPHLLNNLRLGAFRRREYHDLMNIVGISAVIRNGKTVGLFPHLRGSEKRSFHSFAAKLDHLFPESLLLFMFFPIAYQEEIRVVGLRRIKDIRFPACCPVIQVKYLYLVAFSHCGKN
jgi:hypothetical protein